MIPTYELATAAWVLLLLGAVFIGIAKTALPGLGTVAVAMFAAVLPAKESTAVVLVLLLVGDLLAVWTYRKDVDWKVLRSLLPISLTGLGVGVIFLALVDDAGMKRMIGIILLTLTAATLFLMWRARVAGSGGVPESGNSFSRSRAARWIYGGLGGFTTMVANSGGPPVTLYFLASGFDRWRFLGTQAWFFFVVNLTKIPFQGALGLYSGRSLATDLMLVPAVLVGAVLGRVLIRRMNPAVFNPLIIGLTIVSSTFLLI